MTDQPSRELLKRLTLAAGAPGAEDEVRAIVHETLAGVAELSHDRLGSVIAEQRGGADAPRIVLDAHMDEVAFMVQSVTPEGDVLFVALGGWWGHVLLAQRVTICTDRGKVPGVVASTPPHFLSPEARKLVLEIDAMFIDVGATSADEVEAMGIRPGDSIVPACEFLEMAKPGLLSSKAFDDRAGCGVMIESMIALAKTDHPNTVVGVAAAQEEVGCRGAGTAAEIARPDVGIVLEGTPADDIPGFKTRQAILGRGPQIRFFDPTAISNRRLVRLVEKTADEEEIEVQVAVRRSGGTDAKSIHLHRSGVPTVVIGVPARYIHTHVSLIQWEDYVAARDLVVALVRRLDAAAVAALTTY